jgi:creatinine amidohydrolase
MKFGELTYQEIRKKSEEGWQVIVPTGCTEQQGPHLPIDFDTWFVEQISLAAAEVATQKYKVPTLVLPVLPFGPTPEHRNFGSGYIDIPQALFAEYVLSILNSLSAQGFQRMIVWRGCGGHKLVDVVEQFNANQQAATVFLPDLPYHGIWCRLGYKAISSGHADSFATSIALYLRPSSVRCEEIKNPNNDPVVWDEPALDFARYSSTGVIGDPTYASAELGAKLWNEVVEIVARIFSEIGCE